MLFTAGTDPEDRRRGDSGDLDGSIFCFLQLGQIRRIGGAVTTVTWTDLYLFARFTAGTDPDDRRHGDYGDLDGSIFCFLQLGRILTIGGAVTTVTWTDPASP